jgi:hypothetical protein
VSRISPVQKIEKERLREIKCKNLVVRRKTEVGLDLASFATD